MSKGDDHEHSASCDHGNGHDSHGHDSAHDSHGHDDHGHGGHAAPADAAPEHDLLTKALVGAAAGLLIGVMGWWMTVPLPEGHESAGHGEHQTEHQSEHQTESPGEAHH